MVLIFCICHFLNIFIGLLKYYEARYKIITQHITLERATDVTNDKRKTQTLENILNKTNCKTFGLNYVPIFERSASKFALETNKVLVLGYDVAHPPPMTSMERRMVQSVRLDLQSFDPSVVGVCLFKYAYIIFYKKFTDYG